MTFSCISNNTKRDLLIWISFLTFQVIIVILYGMGLKFFSVLPLFALLFFFFVLNFRYCFYFFIFSLFLGQYLFPDQGTRVADFILAIFILSYLAKGALRGELSLLRTPLDKPILLFLGVLSMSLINTVDLGLGIKNLSRHIQLFALFYVIQSEIKAKEINKFLKFFLFMTIVHSIYNLCIFISEAGKVRAFGIAGISFSDMLVASLIICYSFYLYMEEGGNRLKYAVVFFILLGALFATQTRGALVSFFLSYIFASIIVLKKNKIMGWVDVRKSLWKLTILMGILILLAFLLFEPLSTSLSHKFYPLYQPPVEGARETIQLRLLMWETAFRAFLTHPFLGIGVGQFTVIHLVLPDIRFSPLFQHIAGLGAHNIVLAYLSQTGILGLGSLLYLMLSFLRVGWNTQKCSITKEELSLSTALLGIMFFVAASSFYAGAWFYSVSGMEFMLFMALLVILHRSLVSHGRIKIMSK